MTDTVTDPVEDFLEHFGVPGMKWGHRKAEGGGSGGGSKGGSGGSSSSKSKAVNAKDDLAVANVKKVFQPVEKKKFSNQEIKDARLREEARADKVSQHARDLNLQTSDRGRAAAAKVYQKSLDEYLNSPDGDAAQRMTTGEKVAAGLGAAFIAVSIASTIKGVGR